MLKEDLEKRLEEMEMKIEELEDMVLANKLKIMDLTSKKGRKPKGMETVELPETKPVPKPEPAQKPVRRQKLFEKKPKDNQMDDLKGRTKKIKEMLRGLE